MNVNDISDIRKRRGFVDKRDVAEHMLEEERNLIKFNLQSKDKLDSLNGEGVWGCLSDEDYALWKDDNYNGTVKAILLNWPLDWDVLFWGQEVTLRCNGDCRPTLDPEWVKEAILDTEWYKKYANGLCLCVNDWYLDNGTLICKAGQDYEIVGAPEPDDGYCDILCCEDGNKTQTTWLEVDEHFQHY